MNAACSDNAAKNFFDFFDFAVRIKNHRITRIFANKRGPSS
jgi:hypothetical protein